MIMRKGWLAGIALVALPLYAGAAQDGSQVPRRAGVWADAGSAYDALARLPRFEGVWQADRASVTRLRATEADAPFTSQARARRDAFMQARENGENLQTEGANCMPVGLPGSMRYPYPIEIIYSPHKVNIVIETHSQLRQIFTDGRSQPLDPDPLFNGNSIGRWDGDALTIETVGLTSQISLMEGIHPTADTRIDERMWLDGADRLMLQTTITDPALFTTPYTTVMTYRLEPDWTLREYVCQENNRDAADEDGRPSMDLGFDDLGPAQPN